MGGVDRSSHLVNVISSCLDLEVFYGEEPILLSSYPQFSNEKCARAKSSSWVSKKMKEIYHHVRLWCEGF